MKSLFLYCGMICGNLEDKAPEKPISMEQSVPTKQLSASINGVHFQPNEDVAFTLKGDPISKQIRLGASKSF